MSKKKGVVEKKGKTTKRPAKSIVCSDCGKSFDSFAPKVKYCLKCRLKRFRPRNPVETKVCACGCGEEFQTSRPWSRFLNTQHRQAYHRRIMEEILSKVWLKMGELGRPRINSDTGCELHDNCLTCPLPECVYVTGEKVISLKRKIETIKLAKEGYKIKQIAKKLGISYGQAQRYLRGVVL